MTKAPWTPIQVLSLEAYQKTGVMHPFTYSDGVKGVDLIPTEAGWVIHPGGPVVQDWAHEGMLDWSWADPRHFLVDGAIYKAVMDAPRVELKLDLGDATIVAAERATQLWANVNERAEKARMARETPAVLAEMGLGKDKIGFYMDDSQTARVRLWMEDCAAKKKDRSAAGGRFTFEFSPCGLGVTIKVKDCITKTEIDVSDYEDW